MSAYQSLSMTGILLSLEAIAQFLPVVDGESLSAE